MKAYYIVPTRRAVLEIECESLRQVCDLISAPRKTQVKITTLHDDGDMVDVLLTCAFPPCDEGKFIMPHGRHVGRGIILASTSQHDNIMDMENMSAPITALNQYINEISF